jgi:ABC-type spermidine/putrescine transport system permease subunit II
MRRSAPDGLSLILGAWALLVFGFLYLPIAVVVVLSFNDAPVVGFPFRRATLRLYAEVLENPELLDAFVNSLLLGVLSAAVATSLALGLALAFRRDLPFKGVLFNLVLVPIIAPAVATGATFISLFGFIGIRPSLWTTVAIAHITFVLPFAFLNIYPRLHAFDRALEEAALDLGAEPRQVLTRVVLPVIRPGLISAALFAFSLSFDEFVRTLLLTGTDRTLPIQFWYSIIESLSPESSAMAVVIIVVSLLASVAGFAAGRARQEGRSS